ncbi:MAG TPA: hypothetical protein VKB52_03890 [Rhodanobacteraceae bacterium]|nr:hypothetical protein [Rhodanobacteraceae bacterium]
MTGKRWQALAIGFGIALAAASAGAADGDLDPTFGDAGIARIEPDGVDTIALLPMRALELPDGKLLFSGAHHYLPPENPPFEPVVRGMLMRMNADGSVDTGFGNSTAPGVAVLPDLVPGTRIQSIDAMVRLADGSIVGTGSAIADAPTQGFVVKLGPDGVLDATFGSGGVVLFPDVGLHAVAVDAAGRIVVCGERVLEHFVNASTVIRLDAAGQPDASFGDAGSVSIGWSDASVSGYLADLALTPDGGIVVGGRFSAYGPGLDTDFAIAKLADDGTFDTAFGAGGWRVFHDEAGASTTNGIDRLALLADGRIVFAGYRGTGAGTRGAALGRLAADGSTDATFGNVATPGYLYVDAIPDAPSVDASALAIGADGKPVVALTYFSSSEDEQFLAFRATADGALDTGFAAQGIFSLALAPDGMPADVRSLAVQRDGRIVIAGRVMQAIDPPLTDMVVVRLLGASGDDTIFADGFDG